MDQSLILFMVLLFVAVVLGLEGVYQSWAAKNSAEAKRLAPRLRGVEDGHARRTRSASSVAKIRGVCDG